MDAISYLVAAWVGFVAGVALMCVLAITRADDDEGNARWPAGGTGEQKMAKVAKEVKEKVKISKSGLPAVVKIVNGQEMALDAASIRLLMLGWEIKKQIEQLKDELDGINARLMEKHGPGCALIATGVCRASLAEREAVRIADAERLKAVLGFRFDDLVKSEISYKPEKKLIEMACDGDEPLRPAISDCLSIGKTQSVTWRAER